MSTKIWVARRFPVARINEFCGLVDAAMTALVAKKVKEVMAAYLDTYEPLQKQLAAHRKYCSEEKKKKCPKWHEKHVRFQVYMHDALEGAKSLERTLLYDIECGIRMWVYRGKVYAIPWGDFNYQIDWPEWSEDYHYQNQTDPPEDIPWAEFKRRGTMWEKIYLSNPDHRQLNYDVINLRWGQDFNSKIKLERAVVPEYFAARERAWKKSREKLKA
jgi:hypothetical protein